MFSNPQAMKLLFDQAVSDIEDDILSVPKEVSDKMKDFEDNPQKVLSVCIGFSSCFCQLLMFFCFVSF